MNMISCEFNGKSVLGKSVFAVVAVLLAGHAFGFGWSPHSGHATITRAAVMSLSSEDRALFGNEVDELIVHYACIPDWVYRKDGTEHYVWDYVGSANMQTPQFYNFHLPSGTPSDYDILAYLVTNSVNAAREGRTHDFACYAGTLAHLVGDWCDPAHSTPNDTHMTTLASFLPPPEGVPDFKLHGMLEPDIFCIDEVRVVPHVLASDAEELAFRLLPRLREATLAARRELIPHYQNTLKGDTAAAKACLERCAKRGAAVLVDAYASIIAIVRGKVDRTKLEPIYLSDYLPLDCYYYNYRQNQYFGNPYWGHPESDRCWDGKKYVPLKLVIDGKPTEVKGFFSGNGCVNRFFVPKGLFRRFTARVGFHADLAKPAVNPADDKGKFGVSFNGREQPLVLQKAGMEAGKLDLEIPPDVTEISLRVHGRGGSLLNYGIFAIPELHR